jgi:cytochrome b involved in lipid metabolism
MPKLKTYRLADLEKYKGSEEESHEGKIVFAIKNGDDNKYYVYDVTEYSIDHPGGDEIMRDNSGTDATEEFNEIGHSASAMEELLNHRVGVIHDDDAEKLNSETSNGGGSGDGVNPLIILGALLLIGGAAFAFM